MFRKRDITAWVAAAALVCVSAPLSLAENHRNDQNRQAQSRPNNQSRPSNQNRPNNNQSVPRPPQLNQQPSQGHHAGQWLRQYQGVPFDQQKKALNNDPNFRKLPPERQERLQQRLQRFNNLPPDRQQRVLNRMETWEHLTPQQKTEARQVYSGIRSLPPERRQAMQNAINALRAMPPDARQRAIESGRFSQFSPQEREMLNGVSKLPLAPAETDQPPQQ
jgi:hypothetical protein